MLLYTLILFNYIFTIQWCLAFAFCTTPENQMGFCILPKNCRTMTEFLGRQPRPIPPAVKSLLKLYKCGDFNNKPRICCPPNPISFKEDDKTAGQIDFFQFPDINKHRNFNLLPKNCGKDEPEFIKIKSGEAQLNEFPWMALLLYDTNEGAAFKCGGTILNEKYILTAAHCVTALQNLVLKAVRVGEHDTKTKKDCEPNGKVCAPPVQDLQIEEVIFHRNYNTTSHHNDIALLRVSSIDLTKTNIGTVCLPVNGLGNFNYTAREVVVTGWGFTDDRKETSSTLQKAPIFISSLKECQKIYLDNRIALINEGQICAGGGADSCGGDSGGPLHSIEKVNEKNKFIQQGIVSFGPCGNAPIPGVYTRVAFYLYWILDNMKP